MRIFIAGGTGVLGRRLITLLAEQGHEVFGTSRSADGGELIRRAGATPIVMDAFDEGSVKEAVTAASPDVVTHQMTAIPPNVNLRRFDASFAETNRLRTEGTDHLLRAARSVGARRFVAQSYAAWPYERRGGPVKTETDPLDDAPPTWFRGTLDAIRHTESATLQDDGLEGLVLRYGAFYGPGSSIAEGGDVVEAVRRRRFPIVGSGDGVWSFVHLDDAAAATALAIVRGAPGIYNVTDDDPAPVRTWLPALAEAVGAPAPRRVPVWVGRLVVGDVGVSLMTRIRGASNAKAKRELSWQPRFASWRTGFFDGLT